MSHVMHFGAVGDGKNDDTDAIIHAVEQGEGAVTFGRGVYRISRTIEIRLNDSDRIGLDGSNGTAKLLMTGPGPAIRIVGTHDRTADPTGFKPEVWLRQRLPMVLNLEIEGQHKEADGIELTGTMQPTLSGVSLRKLRHGIRLVKRNRNVLITGCHIYHNTGVGIYCDRVNLHQFNISGNHISYNRLGGIRIEGSEIRNLQITGNDIEYNNFRAFEGADPQEPTAEILIDSRGVSDDRPRPSVRELTISSNTIQATYSPGGANVRILGPDPTGSSPPGMAAITGNLIGNQAVNVHLSGCRGVSLTGNFIYTGFDHNLLIEDSDDIAIGANSFGHNTWRSEREVATNLTFIDSSDCTLSGLELRGTPTGRTNWTSALQGNPPRQHEALINLRSCQRINLNGCILRDPYSNGIAIVDGSYINISGCQILDTRTERIMQHAISWKGKGVSNLLASNILGHSTASVVQINEQSNLTERGNVVADS